MYSVIVLHSYESTSEYIDSLRAYPYIVTIFEENSHDQDSSNRVSQAFHSAIQVRGLHSAIQVRGLIIFHTNVFSHSFPLIWINEWVHRQLKSVRTLISSLFSKRTLTIKILRIASLKLSIQPSRYWDSIQPFRYGDSIQPSRYGDWSYSTQMYSVIVFHSYESTSEYIDSLRAYVHLSRHYFRRELSRSRFFESRLSSFFIQSSRYEDWLYST